MLSKRCLLLVYRMSFYRQSPETYLEFNLYVTKHTFTAARMLYCKIQLQQTHFLFKQALVVISRTI